MTGLVKTAVVVAATGVLLFQFWAYQRDYLPDSQVVYVTVANRTGTTLTQGVLSSPALLGGALSFEPGGWRRSVFDTLGNGRVSRVRLVPHADGPAYIEFQRDSVLMRSDWAGDISHGAPLRIKALIFNNRVEITHEYR